MSIEIDLGKHHSYVLLFKETVCVELLLSVLDRILNAV